MQEAQRAAKLQTMSNSTSNKTQVQSKSCAPSSQTKPATNAVPNPTTKPSPETKGGENVTEGKTETIIAHKELPNKIFSHLPRRILDLSELSTSSIPSIVVKVGYRINKDLIKGSTAKCIAMLMAFKSVVKAHQLVAKDMNRDLQKLLFTDCLKFLIKCRPLSISMGNAVKYLKLVCSRIPNESNDSEVKKAICDAIDTFIEEEILCSWKAIVDRSLENFNENDTILTLGCSAMVKNVLYNAAKNGKKFNVIVVDTRPKFEGREMLQFLVKHNIPATYILINSISYVMKMVRFSLPDTTFLDLLIS